MEEGREFQIVVAAVQMSSSSSYAVLRPS